jgi:putative ABC transport system permease protein
MLPFSYTFRNVIKYKVTSGLTILGISLVVFVFAGAMMLSSGIRETLVATGGDENVIIIRKASQTEVQSILYRDQAQILRTLPEIALDDNGEPIITNELSVLIAQKKRIGGDEGNVPVRGVAEMSFKLRPQIHIIEGRMWAEPGSEILAGKSVAERFSGCGLGERVRFGTRDWTVVGIFDAEGTVFDSELWVEIEQASDAFRRPIYSSLTFRMADTTQFSAMKERVEDDRRLGAEVLREKEYYANQSRSISAFLNIAGTVISVIFSLAAIVAAMITMYAAVANRMREIGTLRSLGFTAFSILTSFMIEVLMISFTGGIIGVVGAYFLNFLQISTTNWDTFSEISFNFHLNGATVIYAIIFSLVMGLVGGFLPAVRAARLNIVESLRA